MRVLGSLGPVLRHVALFRWHEGTTEAQVRDLGDALGRLPSLIPELRDYRFGPDAGVAEGTWDFAVVADFDDVDAWRSYREHPEHQRVVTDHVRPLAGERASVQYRL